MSVIVVSFTQLYSHSLYEKKKKNTASINIRTTEASLHS